MKSIIKPLTALLLISFNVAVINAQIARTSVVEHFTNTSCSVCANSNNGFYHIITNYPGTLHISFHPSSPYRDDFFNQQNQAENDARTHFYGVFGSTPRLVVNGSAISHSALNSTLSDAANATTNFDIQVTQEQVSGNHFNVNVIIKKIATDNLSAALLFAGVSEDTIYQTTKNGENTHYNVFRKALSTVTGTNIALPENIGDSIVYHFNYTAPSNWNTNHLHTIAMLQRSDKSIINAAKSINTNNNTTGISAIENKTYSVYPNPVTSGSFYITIGGDELQIYSLSGQLIKTIDHVLPYQRIDAGSLNRGIYFIRLKQNNVYFHHKIIVE